MKVLIIGTTTDPRFHTSGFNLGYESGFSRIGCDVVSISHKAVPTHSGGDYDLILLRDTTVNVDAMKSLAGRGRHFAAFTHAELNQWRRDLPILKALSPEIIFLDQPLGGKVYRELPIPTLFLGYGANQMARRADNKDIDVLWVGHGYPARQQEVVNNVFPLRDLHGFNVKVYGAGQPDGPLTIPEMLEAMSRSKIAIHIGGPGVTDEGGYGGRRIYDALASGCLVVSTWSPLCMQTFPLGVKFCKRSDVYNTVVDILDGKLDRYQDEVEVAYWWVRNTQMVQHKAAAMLEAVGLRKL